MSADPGGAAFRAGGRPTLRVAYGGAQLVLDAAAMRLVGDAVTHLRLLYDRDTRRIGLMPTRSRDADGFALGGAAGARTVSAKAFVDRYRVPIGVAFPLEREGDMVVARIPASVPDGSVDEDALTPPRLPEA